MKRTIITFLISILAVAGMNPLKAQTPFSPTVYSGWMSTPNNYFATIPAGSGVTFDQPRRGAGNQFSTSTDGINAGQWQNATAADAIAANRYFVFSAVANSTTAFQVDSLFLVLARSGTGPDSCILQYKSPATGYAFVSVTPNTYTILNPTTNPTTSISVVPASPLMVPASDSIVFRLVAWHASSSLGKMRIVNNTAVYGSSIAAVAYSIEAPAVQTSNSLCVSPIQGDSIQVTFNSVGTFNSGNTYSLELSDASGSFATPVLIGSLNSQANNGTINGFVPSGTANADYRLRIRSSNPPVNGTDTTHLLVNPGLVISATVIQPACPDSTGSIDLIINGGSGTIQYTWSTGANTQDLTDLPGGNVDVIVTDGAGCSADSAFQILSVPAFDVHETIVNTLCHSGTDGEISVTVAGGTAPYAASWTGNGISQTGLTASNLPAGNYALSITDANNCIYTDNYTLTQPTALNVSAVITHASCSSCNGNISLIVSGGNGPYTYLWANNSTSGQILGMPGTYCVEITDANGCTKDSCFVIASTAGLDEANQLSFQLFPNPASETVQITLSSDWSNRVSLIVTDLSGKEIYQAVFPASEQLNIPVNTWSNGTYQMHFISADGKISSGRIVVSH